MFPLRILPRRLSLALGVCAAIPAMVNAQVTYFQRPPTPDQLRAALLAPSTQPATAPAAAPAAGGELPNGSRTRGIVWQNTGTAVSSSAAASASAPLPAATAYAPRSSVQPLAVGQGAPAAALPINFDLGSSRVDRGSLPYIETIASVMRTDPSIQLVIEGHTDDRGSYNRNMVLSWDRALGVFRTLVETYGIEPRRLQPVGKGPLEPMPGTDPSDGANRRVQFRING
jgi:outer membrane protein OmpA-like peptidoglycan-associated protein